MATVYIAETGDDSTGDGTQDNPYLTLSKANTESDVGDTILIMNGTYTVTSNNYNMTANRIYTGESIGGAILDGGNSNPAIAIGNINWEVTINNITFQNFIRSSGSTPHTIQVDTGTTHYAILNNCIIRNITIFSTSSGHSQAAVFTNGAGGRTQLELNGCLFDTIDAYPGSAQNRSIIQLYSSSNLKINACTFYLKETDNITVQSIIGRFSHNLDILEVKNSILYADASLSIGLVSATELTGNSGYNCRYNVGYSFSHDGDITLDPKFIDAPNGDFRLQTNSPCLGTGNPAV